MRAQPLLTSALTLGSLFFAPLGVAQEPSRTELRTGWTLNSSCKVKDGGEVISTAKYSASHWYKVSVPTTVLAAQVAAGEFHDPYGAMNLRKIPGTSYPLGEVFSQLPMPPDSPYACSWWYRVEFSTPVSAQSTALHFDGINYRANIWLNGQKVADSKEVAGTYRTYAFDIGPKLARKGANVLAVEVFAPSEKELGINWVDWNPMPPDKDMGLWSKVYLTFSGGTEIRSPEVATHFPGQDLSLAELTITAELHNAGAHPVEGVLHAEIAELKVRVEQPVKLAPHETRSVVLSPQEFPTLRVHGAEPWWPAQMGKPRLYSLATSFIVGKLTSDRKQVRFGVREISSDLTDKGARLFRVNGKPILIRGGGWAPDMMLRNSNRRLDAEFAYVQAMGLNTIRLEGKIESDEFFRRADELGVLVMAGWCCCDIWEKWDKWQDGQLAIATASLHSQIMRMRSHPSVFVWLNGSDNPPPAEVEKAYIQVLKDAAWPNPYLSSASDAPTISGKTGVKMTGPYDYVPPAYWELDKSKSGGAFGFNTETSPGPALPVEESLKKFIPAQDLWPPNAIWNYHAGGEGFQNLHIFDQAMNAGYGAPKSLDDYEAKAQAMAYDGERAMFEAYARNKYTSTGVIQWMLNNAWPSLIWHLYDYYLQAAGGYFGTKKANEPLHIQYGYDDNAITVVNSTYRPATGLTASISVYDFNLRPMLHRDEKVDVDADAVKQVFTLPDFPGITNTYFVSLGLKDSTGHSLSTNFYWLSTKRPEFDWGKTTYVSTPVTTHPDLTMLAGLPPAKVIVQSRITHINQVLVRLRNPSKQLAFQVRLQVRDKNNAELLPVLWDDNYVSLLPGEERELTARFPQTSALGEGSTLVASGWNVAPETLTLRHDAVATKK